MLVGYSGYNKCTGYRWPFRSCNYKVTSATISLTPGSAGEPLVMVVLLSLGDVDDDEKYGEACQQRTSKAKQKAIENWLSYVQRPLLVQRDRSLHHNQIQLTPIDIPH